MNHVAQIAYAVAASCFAAALAMATNQEWWVAHPVLATMLGLSMPVCVLAGWMSANRFKEKSILGFRFVSHSPSAMAIAAWLGVVVGLTTLALFLFTLSHHLSLGFIVGSVLLYIFTNIEEVPRTGQSND